MPVLIDIHAHVFPEKIVDTAVSNIASRYRQEARYRGLYSEYRELLEKDRFTYGVVSTAATKGNQVVPANNWAMKLAQDPMLKALGTMHPDYSDWKEEIDRLLEGGIKGMKIHPDFQAFYPDDPRVMEIFACLPQGFVLLIHSGDDSQYNHKVYSHPQRLANVVEAFPHLDIIVAHMGGYRQWDEARKWLVGKDVYLDTSSVLGLLDQDDFVSLVRDHGSERILYGSDFPFHGPGDDQHLIEKFGFTPQELSAIMGQNALKLSIFPEYDEVNG